MSRKSVLFVCLGNICRSPMAEAVFLKLLKDRNLTQQWMADSAATCGYHVGGSPDDRTMKVLSKHDIKQYEHTVRIVTDEDFREFDYILGMDDNNIRDLESMKSKVNNAKCKIQLLGSYDPENNSRIIPDPYYTKGLSSFEEVFELCQRACEHFLAKEN